MIPLYTTENGTWLSAHAPIKNRAGKTIAIVEADENVEIYLEKVQSDFQKSLFFSVLGVLFIALILIPVIRKILKREEKQTRDMLEQKQLVEDYLKEVQASVRYASNL